MPGQRGRRPAAKKIRLKESLIDDFDGESDLNIESRDIGCCSLGQITEVSSVTTVEELLAARYLHQDQEHNSGIIVTTNPGERAVEPRLRQAGFALVASFPSYATQNRPVRDQRILKLWFATSLSDSQVDIEEACSECGKPKNCKCE